MFGWLKSRAAKKQLRQLKAERSKIQKEMETHEAGATCFDEQQDIWRQYVPQLDFLDENIEVLKTNIYLAAYEHLPVAVPPGQCEHDYWEECNKGNRFYLSQHGYAELEKSFHEARMRKYQRFQAWFTPCIAILALVVSIISLAQDRSSKEVPPNKEVNPPLLHVPQPPKP